MFCKLLTFWSQQSWWSGYNVTGCWWETFWIGFSVKLTQRCFELSEFVMMLGHLHVVTSCKMILLSFSRVSGTSSLTLNKRSLKWTIACEPRLRVRAGDKGFWAIIIRWQDFLPDGKRIWRVGQRTNNWR